MPPLVGLNDVIVGAAANAGAAVTREVSRSRTQAGAKRRNIQR
jgi:hypothetical protein